MVHLSAKNLVKLAVVVAAMQTVHAAVALDCNDPMQSYAMRYTDLIAKDGSTFKGFTDPTSPQDVVDALKKHDLSNTTKRANWATLVKAIDLTKGECHTFFTTPATWVNMNHTNRQGWLAYITGKTFEPVVFKALAPNLSEFPRIVRDAVLKYGIGKKAQWSADPAGSIGRIELEELPAGFFEGMTNLIEYLDVTKHLSTEAIKIITGDVGGSTKVPILAYMTTDQLQKVLKNPEVCGKIDGAMIGKIVGVNKHVTVAAAIDTATCFNAVDLTTHSTPATKFVQGIPADAFKLLSQSAKAVHADFYKSFTHTQLQALDADFPNVEFRCNPSTVKLGSVAKPASISQVNKECVTGFINQGGVLTVAVLNELPADAFAAVDVNDKAVIGSVVKLFNDKSNAGFWSSFFGAATNLWNDIFKTAVATVTIPKEAFARRKIGGAQYAQIQAVPTHGETFLQKMWSANSASYFEETVFRGIPMAGGALITHLKVLYTAKKFPSEAFLQHVGEDEPVGAANPCRSIKMAQYASTAKGDEFWSTLVEAAHPNCYRSMDGYVAEENIDENKAKSMRVGQLVHLGLKRMIGLKQAEARFGSLNPRLFGVLTADATQCSLLTQALLKKLPAKTLASISADCIANLPEKLTAEQVKALPPALFGQFSEKHLAKVAVADMSKEQFAAFAGVKGIAKHFTAALIEGLTADQAGALSATFIQDLPAEAFKGFKVAVFKAVRDDAWTLVTFEQFKNIPEDAVIEISHGAATQLSSGVAADKKATRLFKENKALLERVKNQQAKEALSGASMVVASVAAVAVSVLIALCMA